MPHRIVVLDGYTLTQAVPGQTPPSGEPGWAVIEALGELTVYDRTGPGEVLGRAKGTTILLTNKTPLPGEVIGALPGLKYIGVLATGVDVVDLQSARDAGVTVTNIPGYSGGAVAQHVFALLLELTNRVAAHDRAVHEGQWTGCADFCFMLGPITELAGKTLGVVGAGDIGRRVARIGHALGMGILVSSRTQRELGVPVKWCDLDGIFQRADVVTLHCPLTEQTKHMVNAPRLSLMKPTSYLLNTARGPLIDEAALASALADGQIAGAGLDVLSEEPPGEGNPLLTAPRCIITPHHAWAAKEARRRLMGIAGGNVRAFLAGSAVNVVG